MRPQSGFSLIEMMIAIGLGMLIILGVGTVYLSNRSAFKVTEGLARIQENARYAFYILAYDIRMAGYQGCGNMNMVEINNLVPSPTGALDFGRPISGYDGTGSGFSPAIPATIGSNSPLNTSDVLEIRMAATTDVRLRDNMNQTNNPILVYDRLGIAAGDIVMITDCRVGDIFIAGSNTNATAITHTVSNNISNDLSVAYLTSAQVMRYTYYAFYVRNSGRTNENGQAIPVLVRQNVNGTIEELAEGVERMRIRYAVDTNNDSVGDNWQTAAQVAAANNWDRVISVRIELLFASAEQINNRPQAYRFDGATVTPTDRKLRRNQTTFITIRNRGVVQ